MKKHLVITAAISLLPSFSFAADDMLAEAMKRIEDLEAKNKALSVENNLLKGKKSYQLANNQKKQKFNSENLEKPEIQAQLLPKHSEPSLAGFYAGINGGYGGGDVTNAQDAYLINIFGGTPGIGLYSNTVSTTRYGGALAGIQLGYNHIFSSGLLIGALTDLDWSDISNNSNGYGGLYSSYGSSFNTNGYRDGLRWIGTARARMGYSINSFTPFISGGLSFGETSNYSRGSNGNVSSIGWFGQSGETSTNKTSIGWAAGAGLEYSVNRYISINTEYLYTSISSSPKNGYGINSNSQPLINIVSQISHENPLGFHQVRVGLNYHFNAGEEKVVAKY